MAGEKAGMAGEKAGMAGEKAGMRVKIGGDCGAIAHFSLMSTRPREKCETCL